MGERKKLSELENNSYFVFIDRKKMPCLYKGTSMWLKDTIYLWVELKEHGCWTQFGRERWVIDYGNNLPDELEEKWNNYLHKTIGSPF